MGQQDRRDPYADSVIAFGNGLRCLRSIIDWAEAGSSSIDDLQVDIEFLNRSTLELERSLIELKNGIASGRLSWWPPIRDEDVERVRCLRASISGWLASGAVSPELVQLTERCLVAALGDDWRRAFVRQTIDASTDDAIKVSELLDAFSSGLNSLREIVLWLESGSTSVDDLEDDRSSLERLERSMVELRDGVAIGRMAGGPPISDEDIDRVRRIQMLMNDVREIGHISPELGDLSEQSLKAAWGPTWRDRYI